MVNHLPDIVDCPQTETNYVRHIVSGKDYIVDCPQTETNYVRHIVSGKDYIVDCPQTETNYVPDIVSGKKYIVDGLWEIIDSVRSAQRPSYHQNVQFKHVRGF